MDSPLKHESDYFLANQAELTTRYSGQVVAIKNDLVLGAYPDIVSALIETQNAHELGTFLVQKVEPEHGACSHAA